jgi:hypothetical protein
LAVRRFNFTTPRNTKFAAGRSFAKNHTGFNNEPDRGKRA